MGLFIAPNKSGIPTIDWEMTPEFTFGTFESWGGIERIRSSNERMYYFFIDAWGEDPKLCLMERGIKHARVVAEILAPRELIDECIREQGRVALYERTFAINDRLKRWLQQNVIEQENSTLVIPFEEEKIESLGSSGLPNKDEVLSNPVQTIALPERGGALSEQDIVQLVEQYQLVDLERNPGGNFNLSLVDSGDGKTVIDRVTGLMWQREGLDITSYRSMQKAIERLNADGFAGYSDWRLPTMAEGLSLIRKEKNAKGQYLHPCFSSQYPFIFVNGQRKPGGYWFVDYKQGKAFWASGTIPGGFGRLCRKVYLNA